MSDDGGVYHDVTTGEWVEVEGGDESFQRMMAAKKLGCDKSDLRPGYDHSDREAADADAEIAGEIVSQIENEVFGRDE